MASPAAAAPLDVPHLFSAKGMVALISGGGTGIGYMLTRALVEAGAAKVYITGRRLAVLEAAAAAIDAKTVVPLQCDVTDKESLKAVASQVEQDAGFLNLVICNAGIGGPQTPKVDATTTVDQWQAQQLAVDADAFTDTFRVNVASVWFTAAAMLHLLDAGNRRGNVEQSSQVVVIASIAGFNRTSTGGWAYAQSKTAAVLVAKQLAGVLPQWGIRANCICPGLFPSDMSAPIVQSAVPGGFVPGQPIPLPTSAVPVGRMGDDRDMAGTILYMVTRAGAYLNGNVLLVDGGRLGTFPATY